MAETKTEADLTPEEIVTPEVIEEIHKHYPRSCDLELLNFEATPATKPGDNYAAILFGATLHYKNRKTGKHEDFPVMLKVMPKSEARAKMLAESNIFVKEVSMYTTVLPDLENFQREHLGLSEEEIFKPWPKCYGGRTDGKNDFLAMENLRLQGFQMGDRKKGLDFDHCKLVLTALAKFHAISYAMFEGDFDKILEKYSFLKELWFSENTPAQMFNEMFGNMYKQQAAMLREKGWEKEAALLEKVYGDDFFPNMIQLVATKVPLSVITHGDSWTNNFLFRYDEESKKPVEVKFVDYQICRPCARSIDIQYFLHSSPQMSIFNERGKELQDIYYEEFTKSAKKYGVDVDAQELSRDNFDKEMATCKYYGCTLGFLLAAVTSADSSNVPDLEKVNFDEMIGTEDGEGKNFFASMVRDEALVKIRNLARVHLPQCEQMKKHL